MNHIDSINLKCIPAEFIFRKLWNVDTRLAYIAEIVLHER